MTPDSDRKSRSDVDQLVDRIRHGPTAGRSAAELDLKGVSLSCRDLSGVDLSEVDLSGADLTGTDLSKARLFRATLKGASLLNANLTGAELTGADLTGANLEEAKAENVGLGMACLRKVRFFRAHMDGATLSQADLNGADMRCASLRRARFRQAVLEHADLTGADLTGADMALCSVAGSVFRDSNMQDTRLRVMRGYESADWIGVDIRNVNFAGAYRMRRFVADQNYLKEFRESSSVAGVLYYLWWVTSDCGRSLSRWCVCTVLLALLFTGLYAVVRVDYGEHRTWLSALYYSVVTLTTLGYGDVVPASVAAQVVAMIEVATGYVMLGGLLSILSGKMARRAD